MKFFVRCVGKVFQMRPKFKELLRIGFPIIQVVVY